MLLLIQGRRLRPGLLAEKLLYLFTAPVDIHAEEGIGEAHALRLWQEDTVITGIRLLVDKKEAGCKRGIKNGLRLQAFKPQVKTAGAHHFQLLLGGIDACIESIRQFLIVQQIFLAGIGFIQSPLFPAVSIVKVMDCAGKVQGGFGPAPRE